jgi:alpha-mannosidase
MNHIGSQTYEYALVVHEQPWDQADIPQRAWEYNCPVLAMVGQSVPTAESLVETSNNVIVQALRRDGMDIELRMMECLGEKGKARLRVNLPHTRAVQTNLLGRKRRLLEGLGEYTFDVRPQQIVTIRLTTDTPAPPVRALRTFDSVIPPGKRQYMRNSRNPRLLGHPPTK